MQTRLALGSHLALAILVGSVASVVASAQTTQQPEPREPAPARPSTPPGSGIEEIVVLGSESAATEDFGASDSVTGFGAEDLAALGAESIADLAEFTPNLEIVTSGATTPTFFIRGVGLNDFNANSTGAVAIYRDDVAINAPALQLGTLFDVEAVNVLRGPQGTGLARNASAGAIKIYSRKPSGEFGGFLRSDFGNFSYRDFEGAIETPIYEDLLAGRFAFRLSQRDGTMENRCAGAATPFEGRAEVPPGGSTTKLPQSLCGELVETVFDPVTFSPIRRSLIPEGLPSELNDRNSWAARGTLLFQPTLDSTFLLSAHGSRRDEFTRVGQAYGTFVTGINNGDGILGGQQRRTATPGYQAPEVQQRLAELEAAGVGFEERHRKVANELARNLDSEPWRGDFNLCSIASDADPDTPGVQCRKNAGKTINDTWGGYVEADVVLPSGLQLTTVTGYDTYDRFLDTDLDFSPETLFHITTDDDGWQVVQDLRLQGRVSEGIPVRWELGSWFLREQLNVLSDIDLGFSNGATVRDYTQNLWSTAGYMSLTFDFWERFTLDGGFRYNWERKTLDYSLDAINIFRPEPFTANLDETWQAPTGTVRLTYRFREDTHVYWKYTRGWKPGTYNATASTQRSSVTNQEELSISVAEPETIDAFETGVRASWLQGRLGLDFSLFYYDYQDYQLFVAQQFAVGGQGVPEFVILNASSAEVYGSEVDLVARPWAGAFANVRFGWLESQFLDFVQLQQRTVPGGGVDTVEVQNTGNRLLNSPQFKVSLTAEQTLQIGRWGALTARYDGVWTDDTFYDATEGRGAPAFRSEDVILPENTIGQRAYWVHNLRLSYRPRGGRMEVAAWGRNLTNKAYKTFAFDGNAFNKTTLQFVGDPRTFGGSFVVNF